MDTSAEAAAERARRQLTGAAAALVSGDLAKQVVQGVRREAEQEAEERARREREVAELCEQLRGSLSLEDAAAKLRQVRGGVGWGGVGCTWVGVAVGWVQWRVIGRGGGSRWGGVQWGGEEVCDGGWPSCLACNGFA